MIFYYIVYFWFCGSTYQRYKAKKEEIEWFQCYVNDINMKCRDHLQVYIWLCVWEPRPLHICTPPPGGHTAAGCDWNNDNTLVLDQFLINGDKCTLSTTNNTINVTDLIFGNRVWISCLKDDRPCKVILSLLIQDKPALLSTWWFSNKRLCRSLVGRIKRLNTEQKIGFKYWLYFLLK